MRFPVEIQVLEMLPVTEEEIKNNAVVQDLFMKCRLTDFQVVSADPSDGFEIGEQGKMSLDNCGEVPELKPRQKLEQGYIIQNDPWKKYPVHAALRQVLVEKN
jgi:hypothetical protein